MFLHLRGGYSFTVLLFFLMLVGTCRIILSASLSVVRSTYRASPFISFCDKDRGSGVIILNKSDYIKKMGSIIDDITKRLSMDSVDLHDNTAKNEQKLQKCLFDLVNQNILTRDVYDRVRPTG